MTEKFNLVLIGTGSRTDLEAAFQLEKNNTALIITDIQYFSSNRNTGMGKIFKENGHEDLLAWRFDRIENLMIPNLKKMLDVFRQKKMKIVYITVGSQEKDYSDLPLHIKKNLKTYNGRVGNIEANILDEIQPLDNEFVFNKTTVGAFASTPLDYHLRSRGIENLLFAGVSTCCCVDTTARAAADLGYHSVIIEDACSDVRQEDHEWTLFNFQRFFGLVMTTERLLEKINKCE